MRQSAGVLLLHPALFLSDPRMQACRPCSSLPISQYFTPYGAGWPFAARTLAQCATELPSPRIVVEVDKPFMYATQSWASATVPASMLTTIIGVAFFAATAPTCCIHWSGLNFVAYTPGR